MFAKLYRYHLKSGKEQEYLKIQKEADRIYSSYIDKKTLHLQSSDDRTEWLNYIFTKMRKTTLTLFIS